MQIIKIYDCSNSKERPAHRKISKCPKENTIMRDLKKYCKHFNCRFVTNVKNADVIITNDIFPAKIQKINKPKIKRMDGIFWQNSLKERNIPLNNAAVIADHVIFISEFSRDSYFKLYGKKLKNYSVILNNVDGAIFYNNFFKRKSIDILYSASASNWERLEKRLNSLIALAKNISNKIILIGKCDKILPPNIIKMGYIKDEKRISEILGVTDIFINLSYRDAAPKTVCQAVACGLPILYANSGGVKELVTSGVSIKDNIKIEFENTVPQLKINNILKSHRIITKEYVKLKEKSQFNNKNYLKTMKQYFKVITRVAHP